MKTERPKDAQPYYGSGAQGASEARRGTAEQKEPCQKEHNGGNPEVLEVSSGQAQPKMKNDIEERRVLMLAGAGNKQCQRFSQRLRRGIESPSFVIDYSEIIIRGHQSNAENQQRHHLPDDLVTFAGADRHVQF